MDLRYKLKQHSQSNSGPCTGNNHAGFLLSSHRQGPSTGAWDAGVRRGNCFATGREKYTSFTLLRAYVHSVHVPYEWVQKGTLPSVAQSAHMHALPLC